MAIRPLLNTLVLGLCGFALNMLELQLGWGMHFIFGNALVFAFIRILPFARFVTAISISSCWSIVLWNHPWAWTVWTIEAAIVALCVKRTAPIRADLLFWVILGTPLLLGSYGAIMHMDGLSLQLVIAKQAINGILNVALGELLYAVALPLLVRRARLPVTRMPIEAFVIMIMVTTITLPAILYLAFDAKHREQQARSTAARMLEDELRLSMTALGLWQTSRTNMLRTLAEHAPLSNQNVVPLPAALRTEFSQIDLAMPSGQSAVTRNRADAGRAATTAGPANRSLNAAAQLIAVTAHSSETAPQLSLILPLAETTSAPRLAARLRPGTLSQLVAGLNLQAADTVVLAGAGQHLILHQSAPGLPANRLASHNLTPEQAAAARSSAVLVSSTSYGNALMSDLKNAAMLRTIAIPGLKGWDITGTVQLSKIVLAARKEQLELFATLAGLIVLVTAIGSVLAKRIAQSLRTLAQAAADLAMSGTNRTMIDRLVIRELSDISINIATVGSAVARERGALISYQRRLSSIARHAPIVVYALDSSQRRKARLQYVSEAIESLLGFTHEEASAPGWWARCVHPDDLIDCLAAFKHLKPGGSISQEYRLRHKLGHYVWVYDTLALEQDPGGGRPEAVGLILDVSERRRTAEQLIQADKMASLGRMVAGIAHELNQPLNFIKLAVSNLRERTSRDQFEAERFLLKFDSILANVGRASAIILQMRVFGRTPTEAPQPILVKASVDDLCTLLLPQFEAEGIVLDTAHCDPTLKVKALPVLLEQVLLNLLLNARDAIQSNSAVSGKPGVIRLAACGQGTRAIITVHDNGPGVPDHLLPRLFEPFFTTKPPRQGTGLGLSISYGIIRDLGGTIVAENCDNGARFTIDLPLSG